MHKNLNHYVIDILYLDKVCFHYYCMTEPNLCWFEGIWNGPTLVLCVKVWPLSWAWIICPQKNLNFSQFFFIIPLPLEFLTASGPSECDVPPHLAQPCCVALRRALIWGLYPDWLKALLIGYLRLNTTSNSGQRYSSWHINR